MTYEEILNRMLERIPEDLDRRESSVVFNAIAPAAVELVQMYVELDEIMSSTFADTSTGVYLERRCSERGITRKLATHAIVEGHFSPSTIDVMDERFTCGEYSYTVTKKVSDGVYQLTCATAGSLTNIVTGTLIPVEYINGLESASITRVLIPAEDDEDDESLRARYYNTLNAESYGGNVNDYMNTTNAIAGVGGTKVTPTWDGGGTVKLTIIASDYTVPSETLIDNVQQIIDPTQDAGGMGKAPIGHIVTVVGVKSKTINVSCNITYQTGWDWSSASTYVTAAVEEYLEELRESWAYQDAIVVRTSQLETRILNCAGVLDVSDTKINGNASNLTLESDEIPVKGSVSDGT